MTHSIHLFDHPSKELNSKFNIPHLDDGRFVQRSKPHHTGDRSIDNCMPWSQIVTFSQNTLLACQACLRLYDVGTRSDVKIHRTFDPHSQIYSHKALLIISFCPLFLKCTEDLRAHSSGNLSLYSTPLMILSTSL